MMTNFRFTSMLLVMGLGWGMPGQSMAQDRTITVQVPANQAWASTGVTLSPGMTVQIEASGTVEASSSSDTRPFYHQVPPDGRLERHADKPAPLLPALSLLGRIGTGPVLLVGGSAQFVAGPPYGSGQLFLGINDDKVTDNAGAWAARITILSSSTGPPSPTTGVTIRTPKAVYAPNEPIVVAFSGFPATNDWITVVEASTPASSYKQSIYTGKRRDGSLTFDGFAAGEYEARAYLNWPQGGYNIQARHAFTVENIRTGVVLRTQKPVYAPSESIAVEFFGFPATNDWITVVQASAPADKYGQWVYTGRKSGGSLMFTGFPAGEYEARAYFDWPKGEYTIQARYAFTVSGR